MRAPLVALLLLALAFAAPLATLAATVPGTDAPDRLASAARQWQFDGRDNHTIDLIGMPEEPELLWLAVRIHGARGILETAAMTTTDQGERFEPVINVGAVVSSIRFDPPLALPDGAEIATVHPPRLPWQVPTLENQTRDDQDRRILQADAPLIHPQDNTTSPPVGWTQDENEPGPATGLRLDWRLELQEQPDRNGNGEGNGSQPRSPAAIRFSWYLTSDHDGAFSPQQEIIWRFRFDYEAFRHVERPPVTQQQFDGAYLVDRPHRAALRLSPSLVPLLGTDEAPGEAVASSLDAYSGIDGASIGAEGAGHPPPVIVESRTVLDAQEDLRGFALMGDLAFMTAASSDDEPPPPPGDGPPAYPLGPTLWMPFLVLALALLVLVPRGPR